MNPHRLASAVLRPQFAAGLILAVALLWLSVTEAALIQRGRAGHVHLHDSHGRHDEGQGAVNALHKHRRSLADDGPRVIEVSTSNRSSDEPQDLRSHGRRCGAHVVDEEQKVNFQRLLIDADRWYDRSLPEIRAWLQNQDQTLESWWNNPKIREQDSSIEKGDNQKFSATVNVYVYAIVPQSGSVQGEDGSVSKAQVKKQIKVLNNAYGSAGFTFKLKRFKRRTRSDAQFTSCLDEDSNAVALKKSLRKGSAVDLYIYSLAPCGASGLLGYATFPFEYQDAPKLDGVVVKYSSLPDGSLDRFNLGYTVVHEVGHWLGLYHTFEGTGCSDPVGDEVSDTPRQAEPTDGCPKKNPDTCPTKPGKDPIHNFMDYSDDVCMNQFTKGQRKRMQTAWKLRTQYSVSSKQKP